MSKISTTNENEMKWKQQKHISLHLLSAHIPFRTQVGVDALFENLICECFIHAFYNESIRLQQ